MELSWGRFGGSNFTPVILLIHFLALWRCQGLSWEWRAALYLTPRSLFHPVGPTLALSPLCWSDQSPPVRARIVAKLPHVMSDSSLLSPLSSHGWCSLQTRRISRTNSAWNLWPRQLDLSWQVDLICKNSRKQSSWSIDTCIKWLFTMNAADQIQLSNNTNFVLPSYFLLQSWES